MSPRSAKSTATNLPIKPHGELYEVWVCEWCRRTYVSFRDDTWTEDTDCNCQLQHSNIIVQMKKVYDIKTAEYWEYNVAGALIAKKDKK